MGSEDKQREQWILTDLRYEIARKMPVEAVAREMFDVRLLTSQQWEIYETIRREEKGEYLLDCLQPGCFEKFISVLEEVKAEDLVKEISRYRRVVTSASNPGGHGRTTNEAKYWKDKYINAEKILKKKVEKARILEEKVHNLAKRNNKAFSSIEYVVETQKRANESEFRDIQSNDHPHIDAITQQSDLTREAKRPIRISSAVSSSTASSSHHPASSHEGSDLSASSSSSLLTTNSDDSTQQQDHGDLSNSGNFSDTLSVTQAYYKPFQIQMSDRSDRDSDGAQAVELIPATVNDSDNNDNDNDDTASVRTITKSPSQHSLTFCHLRPSHRDNPESHMHVVEPEGLREFREVHHKITKKYRRTK